MALPQWISENLRSTRSYKHLFRCWLTAWAALVLILPQRSLTALGQSAFFASMVAFMIPPNMPFNIFILAHLTLVFGACLGWAWSAAATAAAWRARDQAALTANLQRVQQQAASAPVPALSYQSSIFHGEFLDTKSTAVFGVFFIIACYFAGWVQATMPKLKISAIFFTIILDIMCSYGPLFPSPNYTLAQIFLKPIGCSIAIALVTQILIFPETLAYGWQLDMVKMLTLNKSLIESHTTALNQVASVPRPETDSDSIHALRKAADQQEAQFVDISRKHQPTVDLLHIQILGLAQNMVGQLPFLELEVTYSHLCGKDFKALWKHFRVLNLRLLSLNMFWKHLSDEVGFRSVESRPEYDADDANDMSKRLASEYDEKHRLRPVRIHETHLLMRIKEHILTSEAEQRVTPDRLFSILSEITAAPLDASKRSFASLINYFDTTVNSRKTPTFDALVLELLESQQHLRACRDQLFNTDRLRLLEPYLDHFRSTHPGVDINAEFLSTRKSIETFRTGARPLFISLVFLSNLFDAIDALLTVHEQLADVVQKRGDRSRVWFPTGLRSLAKLVRSKRDTGSMNASEGFEREDQVDDEETDDDLTRPSTSTQDDSSHDEEKEIGSKTKASPEPISLRMYNTHPRDPDALPPSHAFHKAGRAFSKTVYAFWSPSGLFALRYAIASLVIWIVAVVPASAWFSYSQRVVWVLIMAQTGLALHGGEMIFSIVTRIAGTVIGCVLGMVLWYISTGTGRGNPYGLAAATGVAFIPLMFFRIFAPVALLLPAIMTCVTTLLIVGYSWIDTRLVQVVNTGWGVDVAWRRALLVIVGMVIGFLLMLFPRLASTRSLVRKGFAKSTREINGLFCSVIELWLRTDTRDTFAHILDPESQGEGSVIRAKFIACHTRLGTLNTQINLAAIDVQIRGRWPRERYEEILSIQATLLHALGQLSLSLDVTPAWRQRMIDNTGLLDPQFIADICNTLDLLAKSLSSGERLTHCHIGLLESLSRYSKINSQVVVRLSKGAKDEKVNLTTLQDPLYMRYVTASMAVVTLASQLDRFREVVKDLVGQVPLPGYDSHKDRYDDRFSQAFA